MVLITVEVGDLMAVGIGRTAWSGLWHTPGTWEAVAHLGVGGDLLKTAGLCSPGTPLSTAVLDPSRTLVVKGLG